MIECFEEQTRGLENIPLIKNGVYDDSSWKERHRQQKLKLSRGLELLEKYYYDLWD